MTSSQAPKSKATTARQSKSKKNLVAEVTIVKGPKAVAPLKVDPVRTDDESGQSREQELTRTIEDLNGQIVHLNHNLIALQNYISSSTAFLLASGGFAKIKVSFLSGLAWLVKTCLTRGPATGIRLYRTFYRLSNSDLFDSAYYSAQIKNTTLSPVKLLRHYLLVGYRQGLDPSPDFSVRRYWDYYPDVKASGVEPFYHYHRFGKAENRVAPRSAMSQIMTANDSLTRVYSARPVEVPRLSPVQAEIYPFEDLRHSWPVQQNPAINPATLQVYDHRPEDEVPVEGARGSTFMAKFSLLGKKPDFAGAVAYLNALTPKALVGGSAPDASIVIPVYGQLNYTLNCLHSLLLHESRYSFEIIVGDDRSPDESTKWLSKLRFITHVVHEKNGGFIENCNTSSLNARGQSLILLNNDVRVVSGWLDEIIEAFKVFPKAGLVGSKLFYPDGSLQEAGGIIWQDGSAWNFGRNDDPNRSRYSYARQVDYISGCSIALPMDLWRKLEGFDNLYKPAYAEDSDLCFRVREAGFETWLQPLSRVIHYEGKTSGTDTSQGVKSYQIDNATKLYQRWKHKLASHRPNGFQPWFEYERSVDKRVLIIDATNPAPWRDAGSVTALTTIQLYQRLGYKVTFLPQDNFLFERRQVRELQRIGVECIYAPYEVQVAEFLKRQGHLFDIIQVFRLAVMEKIIDDIRLLAPQARLIFHVSDLHYLRMEREAKLSKVRTALAEAEAIKARELALIARSDCTIVHSPVEAEMLSDALPSAPVVIFPVVTDFIGTDASFESRRDIMFLGGYGHGPNVDAVEYFVAQVWPHLVERLPVDAKFLIVGSQPTERVKALASERVLVTGMVDDLQPWFDRSRVFAASIRFGAGVKGKVTTAMAHGLPIVATPCAAEGMYLTDGKTVLIAEEPLAFADAIWSLYSDAQKWEAVSKASLDFVKVRNSFEMGLEVATNLITQADKRYKTRKG